MSDILESSDTLIEFAISGWIQWRLPSHAPAEVSLPPLTGLSLVTPIGLMRMGETLDEVDVLISRREAFVGARRLILRYRGAPRVDAFIAEGASALALLRFISRQATIPRSIEGVVRRPPTEYSAEPTNWGSDKAVGVTITMQDYLVRNAISLDHLACLGALPPEFEVPVHADVLLDALEAHRDRDFRKALLYSAIAMESFAAASLNSAYEDALERRATRHRVVEFAGPGGVNHAKDPVYAALISSEKFSRLLHECPLYLGSRSLMIDQPDTYRKALQLYGTRNKIAHRGIAPSGNKSLPVTEAGSRIGLETAIEVFRWLGDAAPYTVPSGLVNLSSLDEAS